MRHLRGTPLEVGLLTSGMVGPTGRRGLVLAGAALLTQLPSSSSADTPTIPIATVTPGTQAHKAAAAVATDESMGDGVALVDDKGPPGDDRCGPSTVDARTTRVWSCCSRPSPTHGWEV